MSPSFQSLIFNSRSTGAPLDQSQQRISSTPFVSSEMISENARSAATNLSASIGAAGWRGLERYQAHGDSRLACSFCSNSARVTAPFSANAEHGSPSRAPTRPSTGVSGESCASWSRRTASRRGITSGAASATATHRTVRIASHLDDLPVHVERVPAMEHSDVVAESEQQLQCGERLQAADHADGRAEDAGFFASLLPFALGGIQASVTGTVAAPRIEHGELAFEPDRGAADERLARAQADLVDGEARREIVGAVEHHVDAADGGLPVVTALELHLRIERRELRDRGIRSEERR